MCIFQNICVALFVYTNDSMELFKDDYFDLVISNPPFHFEHETNIEVAIRLFHDVKRCLKSEGRFELVASQHLNFKTHLIKIFKKRLVYGQRFSIDNIATFDR